MYECVDEYGMTVFTDNPTQVQQCIQARTSAGTTPEPAPPSLPSQKPPPAPPPRADDAAVADPAQRPSSGGAPVTVPLQRVGRSLVVQARIGGSREAHLIVDTGATLTVVSREIARDLALFSESPVSMAQVSTAGGQVTVDVVRVGTMDVGGAEVHDVPVAVYDLPDATPAIDGLLGLSFLSHFLVTLDTERGQLSLRPR
jgi:aspartyl protease family protein